MCSNREMFDGILNIFGVLLHQDLFQYVIGCIP